MPFGAHETMEVHECLVEKVNVISHFNLYAQETRNPQLLDMIVRHQQEEIRSYNEIIGLTRGTSQFNPVPSNTMIRDVRHEQIRYGLRNPPQIGPQPDARLSDGEIALAMLQCHKNAANNCMRASLECADPNLRRALLNSAATCNNQAYEVFLLMNQQGLYQIPTMPDQTEANFLQQYQPASEALQSQYGMQGGQVAGNAGAGGTINTGSRQSVLYGAGNTANPSAFAMTGANMGGMNFGASGGTMGNTMASNFGDTMGATTGVAQAGQGQMR